MTSTSPPPSLTQPTLGALFKESLKIGCLSFGGPAAQIALMHKIFVEERKWIDEGRYLHGLNICMLLPGPEAQQLAAYVGWRLRGVGGGLVCGALFVIPGALALFLLAWLYAAHGEAPAVSAAFYGVKACVIAFIIEALSKIGRRALTTLRDAYMAVGAFVALTLFNAPFPLVILAAFALGFLLTPAPASAPTADKGPFDHGGSRRAAIICAAAWILPLSLCLLVLGPEHILTRIGVLFAVLAVVTFGGAYAVLAYLVQRAVESEAWLTASQMTDGLGLAETTPGPLVLVNQFVGFLAGWQAEGGGLALAAAGAAMASWQTFMPSFVWIFSAAPYADRLRASPRAAGALRMVTACVLGVIASLALWFAVHVLFTETVPLALPWGDSLRAPLPTSFDFGAAAIAAAAALALMRYKAGALVVVAGAAGAGLAIRSVFG